MRKIESKETEDKKYEIAIIIYKPCWHLAYIMLLMMQPLRV